MGIVHHHQRTCRRRDGCGGSGLVCTRHVCSWQTNNFHPAGYRVQLMQTLDDGREVPAQRTPRTGRSQCVFHVEAAQHVQTQRGDVAEHRLQALLACMNSAFTTGESHRVGPHFRQLEQRLHHAAGEHHQHVLAAVPIQGQFQHFVAAHGQFVEATQACTGVIVHGLEGCVSLAGLRCAMGIVHPVADDARCRWMAMQHVNDLGCQWITQVDDGCLQRGPREQPDLGGAVGLHRTVIVEVIASEIGEDGGMDAGTLHASLHQPDRRSFHGHHADRRLGIRTELLEQRLQRERIGRGEADVFQFPGCADSVGTDNDTPASAGLHGGIGIAIQGDDQTGKFGRTLR